MKDTVLIFGAGASYDAGIPLLSNFIQEMWETAIRGRNNNEKLNDIDLNIFKEAMNVRKELDSFHGRSSFDDMNIEDILSILTFNLYEKNKSNRDNMSWFIKAIERTIDLKCRVKFSFDKDVDETVNVYDEFWIGLFNALVSGKEIPSIISLNYDLVLERSLLYFLMRVKPENNYPNCIKIIYNYALMKSIQFHIRYELIGKPKYSPVKMQKIIFNNQENEKTVDIEILKLHGSVNFPKKKKPNDNYQFINNDDDPYIIPPVFSKTNIQESADIWRLALQRLREAKNIIFVGYSFPKTDAYMQYFLKTAIGPNIDLNKIVVYDPVLFTDTEQNSQMKERFLDCFSPQIHKKIIFRPYTPPFNNQGTFSMFTETLTRNPNYCLF